MLEQMHREVPGGYDFRMIARAELRQMIPGIGDSVFGASWCPHDGHANPLLLRALHPA
jgi:glycine/D-amino acid oxidase-like deaminating enzyme